MKDIKFRQPILVRGKFGYWHYWGFLSEGHFASPETNSSSIGNAKETSQQFTGLRDRNGREIYEGDVVELYNTSRYRYPVCWIGENAAFGMDYGDGRIEFIGDYNSDYLEVVGNVHENPGLRDWGEDETEM